MDIIIAAIVLIVVFLAGLQFGNWRTVVWYERQNRSMKMLHIFGCACGYKTECERSDVALGAVFECPQCNEMFGHVASKGGHQKWIKIPDQAARDFKQSSQRRLGIMDSPRLDPS